MDRIHKQENISRRGKDMQVLFEILGAMVEAVVDIFVELIPRRKRKKNEDLPK